MSKRSRTVWEKKSKEPRDHIRAAVKSLIQQATELNVPIALDQALVRLEGRGINEAREAEFDLSYAADSAKECGSPELAKRVETVRQELRELIW